MNSNFSSESQQRGFLYQSTDLDAFIELESKGSIVAYTGFDPTGPSLHVGHLLPLMWLRLLAKHGHKPIVLVGGATSLIGDPSGKDSQRPLLTVEKIQENIASLSPIFKKVICAESDLDLDIVNNYDWLSSVQYLTFLRDVGYHFSVNRMLTFDSVKSRLQREHPLSFLEFNYMVLQAYDFMHLHQKYGCVLQMAGSDQWGNIVCGIDLARKSMNASLYGLTAPLLTTSTGKKMGKTEGGAIWLNQDLTSHFDFWQYWRNTDDADVVRFLKLFTDLSIENIEDLTHKHQNDINSLKIILADQVTSIVRGSICLQDIHKQADALFGKAQDPNDLIKFATPLNQDTFPLMFEDFCVNHSIFSSKSEVRRMIQGGGVKLNGETLSDSKISLSSDTFTSNQGLLMISVGKKKHFSFKIV
ncbi:MAG: tyrosine--tRNA ligase [Candidatus Puniceispirillum sp.]|nr:tyrosine--tRNA ligase [Candidatus Pelagibacter sp.]MBA4282673.1 tyrosine--tRNA ligase [Candidatus Puniceispirillum sp.]